jgi:hypothetical protein
MKKADKSEAKRKEGVHIQLKAIQRSGVTHGRKDTIIAFSTIQVGKIFKKTCVKKCRGSSFTDSTVVSPN